MASPVSPQLTSSPKIQFVGSVQPVVKSTTPSTPDAISPVKNQPFSNVTQMSSDPASSTPPAPAAQTNFLSRFWGWRSPSSKKIGSTVDEKSGTSTTVTPDDVSELEDLETHWHMISEEAQRKLGNDWKPTWQLRTLLLRGLRNWLMVVILLVALWAEIRAFSKKSVLSKNMKNAHNFLNVGLSLAISIAIVTGLKEMMRNLRWWFLSLKKRTPYEVSLILSIDSLRDCCRIIWHYPKGMAHVCILWLIINIGMQIAIATQGLTLTVDAGAKVALTKPGNVTYKSMQVIDGYDSVLAEGTEKESFDSQSFLANSYGNAGLIFKKGDISQVPEPKTLFTSPTDSYTYFRDLDQEDIRFQYVFVEGNPHILNEVGLAAGVDKEDALPILIYTRRKIDVKANCSAQVVSEGGGGWSETGIITVLADGDGGNFTVQTPITRGAFVTTYWVEDAYDKDGCGDGCRYINVFESSSDIAWYYRCEVTVGTVNDAAIEDQQISEDVRHIAAQAIALQGFTFFASEAAADANNKSIQYQAYPAASYWGASEKGNARGIASNIAEFAILAIATTALTNINDITMGDQPQRGEALTVEWKNLYLILGLIAGVQLFFMIITSLIANLVFIKDGNPLSIARFLRPMVERLGPTGNAADGKQIAKALDEDQTMVVYSVRHPGVHRRHHLDLGVQRRLRAFPRGIYD